MNTEEEYLRSHGWQGPLTGYALPTWRDPWTNGVVYHWPQTQAVIIQQSRDAAATAAANTMRALCLEILKASYVSLQEIERQIAERLPAPRSTSRKLDGMARDRLLKTIEHYGGGQRGVERARDHIGGAVSQQHVRDAFADREVPTEVADRISMRVATFAAKGFGP